jgi:hypothetical protein
MLTRPSSVDRHQLLASKVIRKVKPSMLVLVPRKSGSSSPRVGSSYEALSIFDAEYA